MDGVGANDRVIFGLWRFDRFQGQLFCKSGAGAWEPVTIGSRAASILSILLREPGGLVTKDALMDAVWPGVAVEGNNLTVQIAALRRVLDQGQSGPSLIQTVPGRGYRFLGAVEPDDDRPADDAVEPTAPAAPAAPATRRRPIWIAAAGIVLVMMLALAFVPSGRRNAPPRMSIAVVPFENLSGNPDENYLAAAVTDDLVTELSGGWVDPVGKVAAAASLTTPEFAAEKIGRDLDVRFALRGSVRRLDRVLRVNAQLVATETGAALWTDRFDVSAADLGQGQEEAVTRITDAVSRTMITAEAERGRRERPNDPDAVDLYLQGRAIAMLPPSPDRLAASQSLYERALEQDPSFEAARLELVDEMLNNEELNPQGRKAVLERTRRLLAGIRTRFPASPWVMLVQLHWLSWQINRCPETIDLAKRVIASYPKIPAPYRWLGDCQTRMGEAEAAMPSLQRALELQAGAPWQSHNDRGMQYALLLLGRDAESITMGKRALADNPEDGRWERGRIERRLAAAYALEGQLDDARREVAEATRLWPYFTLRAAATGREASPAYAEQLERLMKGLALAGLRDHADESGDFGVPDDNVIHQRTDGPTPRTVPGARTLDTAGLVALLGAEKPIVIDTMIAFAGRSIPGAVGLELAGEGGSLSDVAQDHLRAIMSDLTGGHHERPVVAVGWNSERFDGRNLALRLAALGYEHVYWYRGGREAWEVGGLPEATLTAREW